MPVCGSGRHGELIGLLGSGVCRLSNVVFELRMVIDELAMSVVTLQGCCGKVELGLAVGDRGNIVELSQLSCGAVTVLGPVAGPGLDVALSGNGAIVFGAHLVDRGPQCLLDSGRLETLATFGDRKVELGSNNCRVIGEIESGKVVTMEQHLSLIHI